MAMVATLSSVWARRRSRLPEGSASAKGQPLKYERRSSLYDVHNWRGSSRAGAEDPRLVSARGTGYKTFFLGSRTAMPSQTASVASATPLQDTAPIIEQLPAGIFRKDAAGRFVFVNERFSQLKRTPADRILGRTATEIASS